MRHLILLVALMGPLLAGCSGLDDDGAYPAKGAADEVSPAVDAPLLPGPIHAMEAVMAGVDPTNIQGECTAPTAVCFEYPFTLASDAIAGAILEWGSPANDFDLYLYSGDGRVDVSAGGYRDFEAFVESLPPGDYRVVVSAYAVVQETFTLDVLFDVPPNP